MNFWKAHKVEYFCKICPLSQILISAPCYRVLSQWADEKTRAIALVWNEAMPRETNRKKDINIYIMLYKMYIMYKGYKHI